MRRYGARRVLRCFIREERKAQNFHLRRVCAQSRERLRILAGCAKTHGTFAFVNFRRREITSAREKRFVYFVSRETWRHEESIPHTSSFAESQSTEFDNDGVGPRVVRGISPRRDDEPVRRFRRD